jgi:ABC-type antimicrobial peptide transport system permease subunit
VNGAADLARGQLVTPDYFRALGVRLILGRDFAGDDDRPGAEPVAIVSYTFWQNRFGGDPSVTGRRIVINGVSFTIIGVTAPEFSGLQPGSALDVSLPFAVQPQLLPNFAEPGVSMFTAADHWWIEIMGRLKPGGTEEQARANLDVIFRQSVMGGIPPAKTDHAQILPTVQVVEGGRGLNGLRSQFSKPLFILMVVVSAVLLIACANIANLLLARATARQKEIGVRLSMGATRARLIRQLLVESLLLAALGGVAGLAFAFWGSASWSR